MKIWVLAAICYYYHRIEIAVFEDITTFSLMTALREMMSSNGWTTSKISIDSGSSLVPALKKTSKDLSDAAVAEDKAADDVTPEQALKIIRKLKEAGFEIRTPYAKASYHQEMIESSIGVFKRCLRASQLPGSSQEPACYRPT